ncbi:MAG TPA: gliding motility-associated C-terminal domain-containing protein [Dinghuibacter sp.]|uniref:T9SS type B sorting domain-containing protein n=1 Tax=Dinghuibacter sp. TaxID=2024697 RepID=UPI002C19CD24|nr:gliding motility-associated C-terminal domain-containing protein [Dinghuibacter sp.]HTJ12530.1 gliding motility-associated C-terminal domain-containing protein [Dinghuibacter sp.]
MKPICLFLCFLLSRESSHALTLAVAVNDVTQNVYGEFMVIYNGSITASAVGGVAPYTFTLVGSGPAQNNGYFPALRPGTYQVQVTDATGASATTTVTVGSVYPVPSVHLAKPVLPSTCSDSDGRFTMIATGGTPPYQYSIDGGITWSSGNTFTGLGQGYYSQCVVRDANGMYAVASTDIFDVGSPGDSLYFFRNGCPYGLYIESYAGTNCGSNGEQEVRAYGGVPPVLYAVDDGAYRPAQNTTYDPAGEYTFDSLSGGLHRYYAKDATGAVVTATAIVYQYCGIRVVWAAVSASCGASDGSMTLHAVGGLPPYQYTADGINYQADSTFTGLAVGVYSFLVRDAAGSFLSVTAAETNRCPQVTVIAAPDTCAAGKGTLAASGTLGTRPYQFSIDGVHFQADSVFTGLLPGAYTLTLKDAGGYMATAGATVRNDCLQLTLSVSATTCGLRNGSISASGSNGTPPYQYSVNGGAYTSVGFFDTLAAGTYVITLMDGTGLTAIMDTTVAASTGPVLSFFVSPATCAGTGGSVQGHETGGVFPLYFGLSTAHTREVDDSLFLDLDTGTYILSLVDGNNCLVRDTVTVTAPPTPVVALGDDTTLCVGDTLVLSAPPGDTYLWQGVPGVARDTVTGTASIALSVTNAFGCTASDAISVRFIQPPFFSLGNDTILCSGDKDVLSASTPGAYLWSTGAITRTMTVTTPGLYWLQVTDGGCSRRDSLVVQYQIRPSMSLGNDTTLCSGQTLLLAAPAGYSWYRWQDGSANLQYMITAPGTYSLTVDNNGCDTTGSLTVAYNSPPELSLGPDTTICVSEQLTLNAFVNGGQYRWQDGSTRPQYVVNAPGTYTVSITNGCGTLTDSVTVSYEDCTCRFSVPSAFTPNGDGVNDLFRPAYKCLFTDYGIRIYNRWGNLVFSSRDAARAWDGTMAGQPQPTGVYVWQITFRDTLTGGQVQRQGTVLLTR